MEWLDIEQAFELFGVEIGTIVLLYIYIAAAVIFLVYSLAVLVIGSVAEALNVDDDGAFPAIAIGAGVFSASGGLSLIFFNTSPAWSLVWGTIGGLAAVALMLSAIRYLHTHQSNIIMDQQDFIGLTGTCSLPITPGREGQITVRTATGTETLAAYSAVEVSKGERVKIVGSRNVREVDVEKV